MATNFRRLLTCGALCAVVLASSQRCGSAQQTPPAAAAVPAQAQPAPQHSESYGAVEAGQEAYQRAEAQRQANIEAQGALNEEMQAASAPPAYYPYRPVAAVYPGAVQVSWGRRRAFWYGPSVPAPYPPLRAYRGVLEPWPMVPGAMYRYPYGPWAPYPPAQIRIQIGPGAIPPPPEFGPEVVPQQVPTPAPPQDQPEPIPAPAAEPQLNAPNPPAEPAPAPPPAAIVPGVPRPREF